MVFMGNEFAHPDWIEFPAAENVHSFDKCRRLWNLPAESSLKYKELLDFSVALNAFIAKHGAVLYDHFPRLLKSTKTQLSIKRGPFEVSVDFEQITTKSSPSMTITGPQAMFSIM